MRDIRKKRTLWPLPGAGQGYLRAVTDILTMVQNSDRTGDAVAGLKLQFSLRSDHTASSYLRVLHTLGLVEMVGESIYITEAGEAWLSTEDSEIVRHALLQRVAGCTEIMTLLSKRPLRIGALGELLRDLGYEWKTLSQVRYRLRWLEAVDLVERIGKGKPEYSTTQSEPVL